MRSSSYRLLVLGNTLVWLLVGLHLPTVHELTDHGWAAPTSVRLVTAALGLLGAVLLWALLRTPPQGQPGVAHDAAAT